MKPTYKETARNGNVSVAGTFLITWVLGCFNPTKSYKQVSVVPRFGSKQVSLYEEFNIETSNISKKMGYNEEEV